MQKIESLLDPWSYQTKDEQYDWRYTSRGWERIQEIKNFPCSSSDELILAYKYGNKGVVWSSTRIRVSVLEDSVIKVLFIEARIGPWVLQKGPLLSWLKYTWYDEIEYLIGLVKEADSKY